MRFRYSLKKQSSWDLLAPSSRLFPYDFKNEQTSWIVSLSKLLLLTFVSKSSNSFHCWEDMVGLGCRLGFVTWLFVEVGEGGETVAPSILSPFLLAPSVKDSLKGLFACLCKKCYLLLGRTGNSVLEIPFWRDSCLKLEMEKESITLLHSLHLLTLSSFYAFPRLTANRSSHFHARLFTPVIIDSFTALLTFRVSLFHLKIILLTFLFSLHVSWIYTSRRVTSVVKTNRVNDCRVVNS